VSRVAVGASPQEFFLIDRKYYLDRPDLVSTGRTLFGAASAKGQALSDQYFAEMSERFQRCVQEAEWEFWKLGIPHMTRHREVWWSYLSFRVSCALRLVLPPASFPALVPPPPPPAPAAAACVVAIRRCSPCALRCRAVARLFAAPA
jgi:hypothetical protein